MKTPPGTGTLPCGLLYTLARTRRKTLAVSVKAGGAVQVHAPLRMPLTEIERWLHEKSGWIENAVRRQKSRAPLLLELPEDEINRLKALARAVLPEKVEQYAKKLGVSPTRVSITGARTRFGSCSCKGQLNFSCRLMRCPDEAVDYVVVHELCHLRQMNHGKTFYALVASVLPDYKRLEKMLREK